MSYSNFATSFIQLTVDHRNSNRVRETKKMYEHHNSSRKHSRKSGGLLIYTREHILLFLYVYKYACAYIYIAVCFCSVVYIRMRMRVGWLFVNVLQAIEQNELTKVRRRKDVCKFS